MFAHEVKGEYHFKGMRFVLKSKVMRRTGYKGLKRLAYCLPIDGASAMGILLTVGCILPSNSLGAEAVTACRILLAALERHAKVRKIQVPLADGGKLSLEANDDNEFLLSDLKSLHKKLGLNYARHKCAIEVGGFRGSKFGASVVKQATTPLSET